MNVLKNYSNFLHYYCLFNNCRRYLAATILLLISINIEAADKLTTPVNVIGTNDYLKVILGLVFVIGLFFGSTYLFKRYGHGPMAGRGQLRVVDGLHLGNRERLVLVELKNKQILLAVSPGKIEKLDTTDIASSTQASFGAVLDQENKSSPTTETQETVLSNA